MKELISRTGRMAAAAMHGMTTTTRRMVMPLLALTLLMGAGVTLSAASAHAGTFRVGTSSVKDVSPDTNTVTLYFVDGDNHAYDCDPGVAWSVNAMVNDVHSACGVRVWLHQNNNNTGINWCINTTSQPPVVTYANLYISTNPAPCPAQ